MLWNDEWDDEDMAEEFLRSEGLQREGDLRRRPDPFHLKDPVESYLLLSDDPQDQIEGVGGQNMRCISCGHRFKAEIYESCPRCGSPLTQ